MTDKEILEGNKLIAEFMGHGGGISDEWNNKPADYNASWAWLMPVCKKWDTLFQGKKITDKRYLQYEDTCDLLDNCITQYEIKPVFEQLVANIKWLNKQKWYNKNLQS